MSPDVEQGLRGDGNDDDAEYVRKLDFHDRIICAGRRHIYWFTNKEDDESERCVNLVAMQNMYMYFLRNQLLDSAAKIVKKKESAKGIAEPKNKDGKTTVEETVENVEETVKKVKETMETAGELLHKYCEFILASGKYQILNNLLIAQAKPSETGNTCELLHFGRAHSTL